MAEFDFILGPNDQYLLIEFLLDQSALLVPSIEYDRSQYKVISDVKTAQEIIQDGLLFGPIFVTWPNWECFPYSFHEVSRSGNIKFFLKQRHGGPYLSFFPSRLLIREGQEFLSLGHISHYSYYWIEELSQEMPAGIELKKKFKIIRSFIGSQSIKAKAGRRIYWIGNEAQDLLKRGVKTGLVNLSKQ